MKQATVKRFRILSRETFFTGCEHRLRIVENFIKKVLAKRAKISINEKRTNTTMFFMQGLKAKFVTIGIILLLQSYLRHMQANSFDEGRVLLLNKPFEWTSFDVVRKIKYLTKTKKVGHAGTLDPLATGLLIICTGKFTKKINEYMAQEKEYTGAITLGAVTPTYDLESAPQDFKPYQHLQQRDLVNAAQQFTGAILQTPPIHSAIKKDGERAYKLARKGAEIKLDPRPVTITEFSFTNIALPVVQFKVVCGTGTYIRSLANDFGAALGCGGYLSSLCRTRIGEFLLQDAITAEQLQEEVKSKK